MHKNLYFSLLLFAGFFWGSCQQNVPNHNESITTELRAPAYPLITIDPYTSAWSETDNLFDSPVRHWTGKTHSLIGAIRVDGKVYRFMGKEDIPLKTLVPLSGKETWEGNQKEVFAQTAVQNSVSLSATQTHYDFTCGPVDLKLQFVSPLLPDDLNLLSRPVNYINYQVTSTDENKHKVQIYFETTPQWAVNDVSQEVQVTEGKTGNINFVKAGTTEQPILKKKGDNVRIDWGYVYLAANKTKNSSVKIGNYFTSKEEFVQSGTLAPGVKSMTAIMTKSMPAMSCIENFDDVSSKSSDGFIMIGYDDMKSIQYFGKNLDAWWTNKGTVTMNNALQAASTEHDLVMELCAKFDNKLWKETLKAGGKNYADLCVLAFRQSIAAHKLVKDTQGNLLFLSKENFSNGSIGTVDVTYPSAPLFLKYNTDLLKGMLNPIFYFSESGKWTKPFAAHDVGTYPQANGQTYGGDMPVEECGNMVIMTAAIAEREGNADYASKHWNVLTTWANYLLENGLNPENQLCTDDFAGHIAHNTNLSIKAIMGIASYGKLAKMLGKTDIAKKYSSEAKKMATQWVEMASDGDHFRLTFNRPGTWSQKYNLVWDKVLKLNIFPKEVEQKEIAYYLTKQNKYGLPLDNRRTYTKADWIVWTASLTDDRETFEKFIGPLHDFVTETPDRVPMSDWYETTDAKKVGFQARSVVGGYFIKLLK